MCLHRVGRTIISGGAPEGLSPSAACYGLHEEQVHVYLQLKRHTALTLTAIPTVAMTLSCSLANFSRIHCQEEEEEKTDFFFFKKISRANAKADNKEGEFHSDPRSRCKSDIKPFI